MKYNFSCNIEKYIEVSLYSQFNKVKNLKLNLIEKKMI